MSSSTIEVQENFDLRSLNTFGIGARARYYCRIENRSHLKQLIKLPLYSEQKKLILGGGSNILFTKDYDGIVIKVALDGFEVVKETPEKVWLKGASGISWHTFVIHAIENNWGGIENLSLIPGTLGAAPIQNIGAYGVELKDVVHEVEGVDLTTGESTLFSNDKCQFEYRDSVFKKDLKEKIFISSVTLTLTKNRHKLATQYGAINDVLLQKGITKPSIRDVSDAVIQIRREKLPDPSVIGNAGSFFKNPSIQYDQYVALQNQYPNVPGYPIDNQFIKVPAGWLIEQCGWKGKRFDDVGVHEHQALVLVNYKNGTGKEILMLANKISESVKSKFGIELTPEVNIV